MRILVVEDDPKISSFVAKGLQESGYSVDQTGNGLDAAGLALSFDYDAAVVDLMLPQMDGLSLIKQMRSQGNRTPVIVLSARRSVEDRVECLESGADDYLPKPFAFTELLARLHAAMRRSQTVAESSKLEAGGVEVDLLTRKVQREGRTIDLQPREFSLLEHLMRNSGRALSKTYLLERLWDYSFDPQTNVVDVLVCRLRNKLDKDFSTKLIHTLRGVGYVFRAA